MEKFSRQQALYVVVVVVVPAGLGWGGGGREGNWLS